MVPCEARRVALRFGESGVAFDIGIGIGIGFGFGFGFGFGARIARQRVR